MPTSARDSTKAPRFTAGHAMRAPTEIFGMFQKIVGDRFPGPYNICGYRFGESVPKTAVHPAVPKPDAGHNSRVELAAGPPRSDFRTDKKRARKLGALSFIRNYFPRKCPARKHNPRIFAPNKHISVKMSRDL